MPIIEKYDDNLEISIYTGFRWKIRTFYSKYLAESDLDQCTHLVLVIFVVLGCFHLDIK